MSFWAKSLIIFSVSFAALSSFFLYRELTKRIEKTGGESIGTITFKKRSASRRYSDNVIWEEIEQESDIYNYDAIRTLDYSSAVIALKDGTKIELDQNTLLVVILNDRGININFDRGGVSAQSGTGTKGLITLNSKDATVALDKGGVTVNSSDAGMNINVNSGVAKVSSAGKELNITADEVATLKDGVADSRKASLFPESPGNNTYFVTFGRTRKIDFSWRSNLPGEVRMEISRGIDFKNIFKSYSSAKPGLEVSLPGGDYYWRIIRDGVSSQALKFTVLADNRPEPIAPHDRQKITVAEGSEIVTFRWEKSEYAASYILTAARDSRMTDIVLTLTSKSSIISATGLAPGRYYWTVKNVYPAGMVSDSAVSGQYAFDIERVNFSRLKPVPLDQGPVTTAGPFSLNWKGVQGSKSYRVEISSGRDFKDIITAKNTVNTFVQIDRKLPEGKYFWRVSATSASDNTAVSDTAQLELIRPVEIIALSPAPGSVLFEKPAVISFTWRDPNRGERYLVEISDRADFRNIKNSVESTAPKADLKSPGEGSYFWRVMLRDRSGGIIARSTGAEFTVPGELKIPVLVSPGYNEKIIPGIKKSLRFQWEKTAGASGYELEIFQRIAGEDKTLMIYSSGKNSMEVAGLTSFSPGIYSWKVKAKKTRNGKVTAYTESGKSYFEIEEVVLLPAPEVKNPGVIFK